MLFETEVLTPGEKLKKIIQMFNITQKELAADVLDRSLISKIINNRERVYHSTASKIVQILNRYSVDVSEEWLLEDESTQVNRIVDIHLVELADIIRTKNENLILEKLNGIKELTQKYEIYLDNLKKLEIIDAVYAALRSIYRFDIALQYIELYKEIALESEEYSLVLKNCRRLTFTLLQLKEYYSIIAVANNAYRIAKVHNLNTHEDRTSISKITRNLALAYKNTGAYEKCINCLEDLINNSNDTLTQEDIVYCENLIAKCLIELSQYTKAENKLLNIERENKYNTDNNQMCTVLENLCLLYIQQNNLDEAAKYRNKLQKIGLNTMDSLNKARNLYYLIVIDINLDINGDREEDIEKNFKECFNLAYILRNEKMQYKLTLFTTQYLIERNMKNSLIQLVEFLNNKFKKIITCEIEKIFNEIGDYFKDVDEERREEIIKYATRIRRKFTTICNWDI